MTHVTCMLTAKNRDQLRNPTLGNRVWATFTFFYIFICPSLVISFVLLKMRHVLLAANNDIYIVNLIFNLQDSCSPVPIAGTSSSVDSPLSLSITPHSFTPGLKLRFLQILPTVAFLFFFFRNGFTDFPDCLPTLLSIFVLFFPPLPHHSCLQCFDAVGWAAGKASGL